MEYKRILLKLTGEKLTKDGKSGIDFDSVVDICTEIKECVELGYQFAIVIGGGNIWRGRDNLNMDRVTADNIGMLATFMNALALRDGFRNVGINAKVYTSIEINKMTNYFNKDNAILNLERNGVVILGGGIGNPYFSTDTAAALRALELNADIIFKASNVDGVYSSDPRKNPDAIKYEEITYDQVLQNRLNVMDFTATSLCMENKMPVLVFDINKKWNLLKAVKQEKIGTIIK